MNKTKIVAKKVGIIIIIACLVVVIGNYTVDNVFYNPNRDFTVASSTFSILNQLLAPSITESYLEQGIQGGFEFPRFSYHSQNIRLLKFSYSQPPDESENSGEINYKFGKATLKDYSDNLGLGDLTCQQSVFLSSSETKDDYWQSISDRQSYEVWIKFQNPIDRATFTEKYHWLLDNSISRPKESGIIWIPVKTSDKLEDICIGLAGNLSFHYLANNVFAEENFYNMDLYGRELVLREALKFLIDHQKETDIFINTGLWVHAETVDFEERYEYLHQNEIQYLGFVALINGSDLRTLKNEAVNIVQLKEDK